MKKNFLLLLIKIILIQIIFCETDSNKDDQIKQIINDYIGE